MAYAKEIVIQLNPSWTDSHVYIDGVDVPATSVEIYRDGNEYKVKIGLLVTNAEIRVEDPQVEIIDGKLVVHEEKPKKMYRQKNLVESEKGNT